MPLELIAISGANYIQVIYGPGSWRFVRGGDKFGLGSKEFVVAMRILATLPVSIGQEFEFGLQDPRLERVEPPVVSFDLMAILVRLPMVAQHPNLLGKRCIIGSHCACFSACAQVLTRIEAESCSMAHGADTPPPILFG